MTPLEPSQPSCRATVIAPDLLQRSPIREATCTRYKEITSRFIVAGLLAFLFSVQCGARAQTTSGSVAGIEARASSARKLGNIKEAITLYKQAVQADPKLSSGWWSLGVLEYSVDEYAAAIDSFTHLIELDPSVGPAFALRGICEFDEKQYSKALLDLQRGAERGAEDGPRNASIILYHEALLLTRLGRFEEAAAKYNALLKYTKLDSAITDGLGLAVMRMKVLPTDVDFAQHPIVVMAGDAAGHILSGDFAKGDREFREIFARYPKHTNLHYLYGLLLINSEPEHAIAQFKAQLLISPSNAVVLATLAWAEESQDDFAAALPLAEKAVKEDPSLLLGQLALGRDLVEVGRMENGLRHLELVIRTQPGNLEAHLALAKAYSKLGDKNRARRERLFCLSLAGQGAANAHL